MRGWLTLLVLGWALFAPALANAENRMIVRGNYYRERSTRVIQPLIHINVDAPDERLTLGAAYLLDAISSASIATGTTAVTGGDNVFTEIRHEALGTVSSKLGEWNMGGFFRYSTETDFVSRSFGFSGGRDFLQRSMNFTLSYSVNLDRVFRIVSNLGDRRPWCGGQEEPNCSGSGSGPGTNLLQVHYLSLLYTHAVHKQVLVHASAEAGLQRGPQDNPYRGEQIPAVLFETHPIKRNRFALTTGLRYIIPRGRTVIEPRYRFYADDWNVIAHSVDTRFHFRIVKWLVMRLRYRFYTQSESFLQRDDMMYEESEEDCTRQSRVGCATADPKMDNFLSHTPGIRLTFELDALARFRGLAWLERGWIEATYNHIFQTNRFGNARLASLAFSLAF